jgi:hypothetical protein
MGYLTYPPPIETWNKIKKAKGRQPTKLEFFKLYRNLVFVETDEHRINISLKLLKVLYEECERGSIFSRCSWAPSEENLVVTDKVVD